MGGDPFVLAPNSQMLIPNNSNRRARSKKSKLRRKKKTNSTSGRKHRESSRSIKNRTSSRMVLSSHQIDQASLMKSPPTKDKKNFGSFSKSHKRQSSLGGQDRDYQNMENKTYEGP